MGVWLDPTAAGERRRMDGVAIAIATALFITDRVFSEVSTKENPKAVKS
jgi:hypothetical protein